MKNLILQAPIRGKIDKRVDRILADLGSPEPPLVLEDVRELLELDLGYYQKDTDGFLQRKIHHLKMAGKQIAARPSILIDALRKFDIKALYVPDRKRILIDETLPKIKHRWATGHEIIHSVLNWHKAALLGDDEVTLKQSCREKVEAEANYGAGQLLFLRERFRREVLDSSPSVDFVIKLAKAYKNTNASTLWRLVETVGDGIPMLGVMHYHPHPRFASPKFDPANPCRHFIRSGAFAARFATVTELQIFDLIASYIQPRKGGPQGSESIRLTDDNGEQHDFRFETFGLVHECLTLCIYTRKAPATIALSSPFLAN